MSNLSTSLSVIVPVYNEADRGIGETLSKIDSFLSRQGSEYEIILSDDGSTDSTVAAAESFAADHPRCVILRNPHRGKGSAVRSGVLAARLGQVLFLDADLATPIEEVERLLPAVVDEGYDLAIASREGAGARRIGEPFYRHLMGRVFNFLVQLLVLPGINDSQCGFKLFTREAARRIFERLRTYGEEPSELEKAYLGAFDVEVLLVARKLGYKIKEIPVTWTYAPTRRLRPLPDSLKMAWDVIKVKINDIRGIYK